MCINKHIVGHKYLEIEGDVSKDWWHIMYFNFDWTRRVDHAGMLLQGSILGLSLSIHIYDDRHWEYVSEKGIKNK